MKKRFEAVEYLDDIQPGDYIGDGLETGIVLGRAVVGKSEGFRIRTLIGRAESIVSDHDVVTAARLVEAPV